MIKNKGFTILELLVVVAIIAIIAVIAIPNYLGAVDKAKAARELADADAVQKAVQMYYLDTGIYPTVVQPADGSAQTIDMTKLVPDYLASMPNNSTWSIDSKGTVSKSGGASSGTLARKSGDPATMLTSAEWALFDWSSVKAPTGQTSAIIGVDAWGNTVNMDLWVASKVADAQFGTVGTASLDPNGYKGSIVAGKIEGYVPAYVKLVGDTTYTPVTGLISVFSMQTALVVAPIVHNSVVAMFNAFSYCANLATAPVIPHGVTNLNNCFWGCSSLTATPVIPNGMENMNCTFAYCTGLTATAVLPSSVTNTTNMYLGCTKLGY